MATDFSHLLAAKADDVKRPPVKPAGTYHAIISGYEFGKSKDKGTPFVMLKFNNVTPGPDIDPSALVAPDGEPIDLSKWTPSTRGLTNFYITENSLFRLKEFMEGLGIPSAGRSLNEMLPDIRNQPVLLVVAVRAYENGDGFFNEIEEVKAAA